MPDTQVSPNKLRNPEMKLFGSFTSPFVRHCRLALMGSEIEWQLIDTDYAGSAKGSPTQKVPFAEVDALQLTDSCSILRYIREQSGAAFLKDVQQYDYFLLINTLADSTINLFLIEKGGDIAANNSYFARQQARINAGLQRLEELVSDHKLSDEDVLLRLVCYLDWALYRERISLGAYPQLSALLADKKTDAIFNATHPSILA